MRELQCRFVPRFVASPPTTPARLRVSPMPLKTFHTEVLKYYKHELYEQAFPECGVNANSLAAQYSSAPPRFYFSVRSLPLSDSEQYSVTAIPRITVLAITRLRRRLGVNCSFAFHSFSLLLDHSVTRSAPTSMSAKLLSLAVLAAGCVAQSCVPCDPNGWTTATLPPLGSGLANLYVDLVNSVAGVTFNGKRALEDGALEPRATSAPICCEFPELSNL